MRKQTPIESLLELLQEQRDIYQGQANRLAGVRLYEDTVEWSRQYVAECDYLLAALKVKLRGEQ